MNNILGIIDSDGNLVVKYECTAYGVIKSITGTLAGTIGAYNPFRYKGYYYDTETNLYLLTTRYYSPEWCRFISPDSVEYLDPSSINGLNLYAYCGNDPVNYVDPSGHMPIYANGFSVSDIFDLSSTIIQLLIGSSVIAGQRAVLNAIRPNNIGLGIWNKMRKSAIDAFEADTNKLNKMSHFIAISTVIIQVGENIYSDYNRGYTTDRIISNAIVNTALYGGTMWLTGSLGAKIGGVIGSFCPIPVVGTVVGTAFGYIIGIGASLILEMEIEGKSLIDHVRDWFYETLNGFFN